MKRIVTLLGALVLGLSLAVPTFASPRGTGTASQASATTGKVKKVKASKRSKKSSKRHMFHARKKGTANGKKAGQQGTNPSPTQQ